MGRDFPESERFSLKRRALANEPPAKKNQMAGPRRPRLSYGISAFFAVAFVCVLIGGMEFISSFETPSWPAREIRPISTEVLKKSLLVTLPNAQDLSLDFNGWSLRDRPRTIARPDGVAFRAAFVGDSFLEHYFARSALPALIEDRWHRSGLTQAEAINFGVTATGPRQYYWRMKNTVLATRPDTIVVVLYSGNDFISEPFSRWTVPPAIAERPIPSMLGTVAPRTTWLLVNRLGLSEVGRGDPAIAGEFLQVNEWMERPAAERLQLVTGHLQSHYHPKVDAGKIREILSRGDGQLWRPTQAGPGHEFMTGWLLASLVDWESGGWTVPQSVEEADGSEGHRMVQETATWVDAMADLARTHGVKFAVALAPTGVVDPDYAAFWRFWPRYYSWSVSSDARHRRFAGILRERGHKVLDLRDLLSGQRGTYRLLDGHWSEAGMEIVSDYLAREVPRLR